jgi:hypothetical protein
MSMLIMVILRFAWQKKRHILLDKVGMLDICQLSLPKNVDRFLT